jgi:starch-binding outer membrane protein, SusD/RagB family
MNKRKLIIYTVVVLMFAPFFTACELDEYNPSGATADAVFSTPEGFETLVNGAYSNLRAQFYGREDIMYFAESGTDIWFNANRRNYLNQIARYEALTPSLGQARNTWNRLYVPINLCNAGIERIENAGFIDQTRKNQKEGELRFLRAYYYWHLVETFGGVHLLTKETKEPILTATRSSVDDFYALIIEDAKFAAENLPVVNAEDGRATKKAGMGLLARAYLTYASYLQYHQNKTAEAQTYYALARDAAKAVIDRQAELNVSLYSNVYDLWNPANNKKNKEAMFVVTHTSNTALEVQPNNPNRLHMWYLAVYNKKPGMVQDLENGRDGSGMLMPTRFLLNLFNETVDARYDASFQEVWYCNSAAYKWLATDIADFKKPDEWLNTEMKVALGDTALYFTKKKIANKKTVRYAVVDIDDTYNEADGSIVVASQNKYYPALKKFNDPYRTAANSQAGFQYVIVMRLAEMYLIAAEAEMALNNTTMAANYLNVLRTRAAIKSPVDFTAQMQVAASEINIDFILDERARELCGEHLRWFDLKRTKQLENRLGSGKANPDIISFNPQAHYLRPVPQPFIDALLNGEEFGQNPGYN